MRDPVAMVRPARPTPQSLRAEVLQSGEQEQESGWSYARAITAFVDAEAWQHFTFGEQKERTREAWIAEDLHGRYTRSAVVRIVQTVQAVMKLPLPERVPFYAAPFWNAVEALASGSPSEATELVRSGKTQLEIRGTVMGRKARKAADNSWSVPPKPETWVHLELQLPAELAARWEGLLNLWRFRLHRQTPAVPSLLEALIVDTEQNFERDVPAVKHTTSDGVELAWTREEVAAGKIRCRMCGSWDSSSLDPHHVIPRSRELECCGVSHPKTIELLCRRCHNSIKDSDADSGWAVWAARWGYGELATQHGGHYDENEVAE